MKCGINTLRDMKQTLLNATLEGPLDKGAISSDGESFDLVTAFYKNLAAQIRDPQTVLAEIEARELDVSKPFHQNLRREVGEEIFVTTAKGEKKYYLLASHTVRNKDSLGGVDVVLRMAPVDNIALTEEFLFRLNSDAAVPSIGRLEGTIEGFGALAQKAWIKTLSKEADSRIKTVELDSEGDKELADTLNKMADVDTVLNSRQNRNSNSLKGFEKIKNYEHGNIDSMKNLLGKLHVLGNSKASKAELDYYMGLFDKMHPRFFNKMNLFVRKTQTDTWGQVNFKEEKIRIDVVVDPNAVVWQSEAEVYAHEVVHTMTSWALRQKDKNIDDILVQLNHAMSVTKAKTKWEDLLEVPLASATFAQKEKAQAVHKYIFTGKDNLDEFIAYVLTNPQLMKHTQGVKLATSKAAPETVFEKVMDFFTKLLDVVTGRFNFKDRETNVFDKVNDLSFRLAELNNKHITELDQLNPVGKMMEALENADMYVSDTLNDLKTKLKNTDSKVVVPGPDASAYAQAKFYVKLGIAALTNPVYRGFIGLLASKWGFKPNGTFREVIGTFFDKSDMFRLAEMLNLVTNKSDASRNSVINASSRQLKRAFTRKISKEEDSAITKVLLNTNLASLRYKRIGKSKRPDTETGKLLTDDNYRKQQIGRVKHAIAERIGNNKPKERWVTSQAVSLGYFMATGKAHAGQNYNADNIVSGNGLNERFEADAKLSTLVEELATLTAIGHVKNSDKQLVAELLTTQKRGIDAITDAYEAYRSNSKELLFKDTPAHMMTGHTMELFDDSIDLMIAPANRASELSGKGYTLRYTLEPKNGDTYKSPMAVYTTGTWGKASRTRGTVGLGKLNAKGTSLRALKRMDDPGLAEITYKRDFARIQSEAIKIHQSMMDGTFDVTKVSYGIGPVIDATGRTTDFRYMMSREEKERLLGQDLRATQVLPRSSANITYKLNKDKLNAEALNLIKQDMKENWEEGGVGVDNTTEYSLIGPDSTDPAMRELYAMLPESYQDFINSRADRTMAVRTELLTIYFGDKDFMFSSLPGVRLLPAFIKSGIDMIEGMWQELIKISKGAILLKMPLILVSNFLSNVKYQINTGSLDLVQLSTDYKNSFREVNEYLNYNRKAASLRIEIDSDKAALGRVKDSKTLKNKIFEKEVELGRLESALARNPAKELFDAGMYQSHIEDIDNSALGDTNRLTRRINEQLDKAPTLVRGAAELAYLTQNTAWYKFSQEALQRTDMVTRLVDNKRESRKEQRMVKGEIKLPRWWLADKRSVDASYPDKKVMTTNEAAEFLKAAKDVRMMTLLDSYVNYTIPNGRMEEYLNSMGILMFTKYLKRIQPVIANTFLNHPLKTALTLLTAGALVDVDIIQEQSLLARGFDPNGEFSLSNILSVYSPLYHLSNVFTPPILKDELNMGLF